MLSGVNLRGPMPDPSPHGWGSPQPATSCFPLRWESERPRPLLRATQQSPADRTGNVSGGPKGSWREISRKTFRLVFKSIDFSPKEANGAICLVTGE